MRKAITLFLALTLAAIAPSATALECVEMPGSIDQDLPGVDKNMRNFTNQKEKENRDPKKTLGFCATAIAPLQGVSTAFSTCSCKKAIQKLCEVEWDKGVPEMKGPAECMTFAPMMF